ncbi:MAG: phosphoglycerate dehydrogenase [Deltaproteobacteria bacterium]|nr:phosphoglycerate dehydrogenase [Deltaproteobacteria bacterium]
MARRRKIFVAEPFDWVTEFQARLEAGGCEALMGRDAEAEARNPYTVEELIQICQEMDGIILSSRERLPRAFMQGVPRLRVISKVGIGVERIDVAAATEAGIVVGHTPVPENYTTVSETTLLSMLALVKRLEHSQRHLRAGGWRDGNVVHGMLHGRTVGLIGLGRVGQAVAERLRSFGVRLLVADPYIAPEQARAAGGELVPLEQLLREADVVSVHVVITPETTDLLNERTLRMMKPTAVIVNTARGEAIDEEALVRALREGWVAGAALDVFKQEPIRPDHPLLKLDNVILTPHVAGWAAEAIRSIWDAALENCLRGVRGEPPLYLKNPEVLPRWRERLARLDR